MEPTDDARPWLGWPVGAKVMVRRRLAEGGYSDLVGLLVTTGPDGVRLAGRRGEVWVPAAEIAIGKVVPPPVLGPRRR